jgi:hypothetical protein
VVTPRCSVRASCTISIHIHVCSHPVPQAPVAPQHPLGHHPRQVTTSGLDRPRHSSPPRYCAHTGAFRATSHLQRAKLHPRRPTNLSSASYCRAVRQICSWPTAVALQDPKPPYAQAPQQAASCTATSHLPPESQHLKMRRLPHIVPPIDIHLLHRF